MNVLDQIAETKKWLGIAKAVSERSGCLKLQVGAVIVKDGESIGYGFNDAAPKEAYCPRADMPSGTAYFLCSTHCSQTHHSETMAINSVAPSMNCEGATIYIFGHYMICEECREAMIHYGIREVYLKKDGKSKISKVVL